MIFLVAALFVVQDEVVSAILFLSVVLIWKDSGRNNTEFPKFRTEPRSTKGPHRATRRGTLSQLVTQVKLE